jgi:hypothetical protein
VSWKKWTGLPDQGLSFSPYPWNPMSRAEASPLARRLEEAIAQAERRADRLQKTHTGLLLGSIVFSAASTLVAGITSAVGPVVGEGVPGWRLACAVAAVFGFVTTVTTGLSQQFQIPDRLAKVREGLSQLRALDLALVTGSRSADEVGRAFEEAIRALEGTLR